MNKVWKRAAVLLLGMILVFGGRQQAFAGNAVQAGTVTVEPMDGIYYEDRNSFPGETLFRVTWRGLNYQPVTDLSKPELGGDNAAGLASMPPERCDQANTLGKCYNYYMPIAGFTYSVDGTFVFENLTDQDIRFHNYAVSFTVPKDAVLNNGNLWYMYAKSYQVVETDKINIDFCAPTINGINMTRINERGGCCQKIAVAVEAVDVSRISHGPNRETGLSAAAYSWDGGASWVADATKTFERNGTYSIWVKDKVNHITKKEFMLEGIDENPPVIKSFTQNPVNLVNGYTKSVVLKVDAADNETGLADLPYSYDGGASWVNDMQKQMAANGSYTIKVRDKVGNTAEAKCMVTNIDLEKPVLMEIEKDIPDSFGGYGLKAQYTIHAKDEKSGLAEAPFSWDEGKTWTGDSTRLFTENGEYDLWIQDKLSNLTKEKVTVSCIDKDKPLILSATVSAPDAVNGYVRKAKVMIEALDKLAGLDTQAYSYDGGASWESCSMNEILQNGEFFLHVRDGLKNTSETSLSVNCIDKEGPVFDEGNAEICGRAGEYGTLAQVTVRAHDDKSGMLKACYSFDNGQTWSDSERKTVSENGLVVLAARDGLGNQTKKLIAIDKIDREKPKVSITGNPKEKVNSNVTLTIAASDDKSGIASVWYQNDAIRAKTILGEYENLEAVKEKVSIVTNGSYRFFVYDRLGNLTEEVVNVTKINRTYTNDSGKSSSSSSSSSTKKTSSSSSRQDSVTDHSIVTTIVEKSNNSTTTRKETVVSEKGTTTTSGNKKPGGKTKVVKLSGNEAGGTTDIKTGTEEELEYADEEIRIETISGNVEENMSPAPAAKTEIQYPQKKEKGVNAQKIVLVAIGIGLLLLLLVFFLFYKKGVFQLEEEEKDDDKERHVFWRKRE